MGCQCCKCQVGYNYSLIGNCFECNFEMACIGEYLGMEADWHVFKLHPKICCPGCGAERVYSKVPCSDFNGIEVTEEFQVMSHRKDSHWISKG